MESARLRNELLCSICLDIYTDPVTLRCGHNFCQICIDRLPDTEGGNGEYCCPECRVTFRKQPPLQKNITLCNVVKNFLATQPHQEEITGICCTYCVDSPVPAVKSCLVCEASLCEKHLRVHSKGPEHVLTDPCTSLKNRKCCIHRKILEYYCTEDAACICVSCSLAEEHRGHRVEMMEEASEKKKRKGRPQIMPSKRVKTEERDWSLEERRRKAQEISSGEAERVTALCTDNGRRVDDVEKRIPSDISKEEEESLSLSDVIQNLEIEDELSSMRDIDEVLCDMTDSQTAPSIALIDLFGLGQEEGCVEVPLAHDGGDEATGGHDGGDEATGGHDGGDRGAELISHISHTLSDMIRDINVIYVQGPADILLDVNTAANNLLIPDDLKTATWTEIRQNRPETAERFQYNQVMSGRRFTSGRHYWDVEIRGSGWWGVGMCYPSIVRRGEQSFIGDNNKSWCLCKVLRNINQYSVIHDNNYILLPHQISSDGVRIYLDYEAGQLSFYELCDPIRHLHTFTAAFSEPLHALLYVCGGSIKISGRAKRKHQHRRNLPSD